MKNYNIINNQHVWIDNLEFIVKEFNDGEISIICSDGDYPSIVNVTVKNNNIKGKGSRMYKNEILKVLEEYRKKP